MQLEVKGRNTPVTDDLRVLVERRFRKVANQVSDLLQIDSPEALLDRCGTGGRGTFLAGEVGDKLLHPGRGQEDRRVVVRYE